MEIEKLNQKSFFKYLILFMIRYQLTTLGIVTDSWGPLSVHVDVWTSSWENMYKHPFIA